MVEALAPIAWPVTHVLAVNLRAGQVLGLVTQVADNVVWRLWLVLGHDALGVDREDGGGEVEGCTDERKGLGVIVVVFYFVARGKQECGLVLLFRIPFEHAYVQTNARFRSIGMRNQALQKSMRGLLLCTCEVRIA